MSTEAIQVEGQGGQQSPEQGQQQQVPNQETQASAEIKALIAALNQRGDTKPDPAPAPEPDQGTEGEAEPSTLAAAYSDPATASMIRVLQAGAPGLDVDRAIGKAVLYGDLSLIDTAYISEKGGKGAKDLMTIAEALVEQANQAAYAIQEEVFSTAGGEENWDASVAVFNKEAPAHLRKVVRTLADSGDREAVLAAAQYVVEFGQQHGVTITKGNQMRGNPSDTNAGQALDRQTFQTELRKLDPRSRDYETQYQQLLERRAVGKRLGR